MSTSNLGTLTSTPKIKNNSTVTTSDPTDVYKFTLTGTRSINLSLNEISSGDDADLYLYRDSNNNGRLDSSDTLVTSSAIGSNFDDAINVKANAGTYFAQVKRYAPGSSGTVTYDLDLSATSTSPSEQQAPNLLPTEVNIGNVSQGNVYNYDGSVGDTNTSDVYKFSLASYTDITVTLSGLSNDADIRVILDSNNNHIVDPNEVMFSSTNGETSSESLEFGLYEGGNWYIQVYQYTGNTSYDLQVNTIV